MKWSVAPALIVAALGALSVAAVARAAHAAVGDAGEGELLGGPDQPNYGLPPTRSAPVKRAAPVGTPMVKPSAPRPMVKPAPSRQAQAATPKPARAAQTAVRRTPPTPPPLTAQVTPPAPWRSPVATREMPQVAAPEMPPEEEAVDVASNNEEQRADQPDIAVGDRTHAPPARERSYAERAPETNDDVSERDFARAEQAINLGLQRGAIGRREAQWLYGELDDIAAMRQDFMRGGNIGQEERSELADRFAALRERIDGAGDTRWRGRRY
jgi:hypothetical protein